MEERHLHNGRILPSVPENLTILYVEDNPDDVWLVERQLAQSRPNWVLQKASTLSEAVTKLYSTAVYNVLILDLNLPDGSGLELISQARQSAPDLTLVVLTGSGSEETAVAALKAGADDYVIKRDNYLPHLTQIVDEAYKRRHTILARRTQPLSLLYVEANLADTNRTKEHLARHAPHIRLEVVATVSEMLERLPQTAVSPLPYNILLINYKLPGLDALDALRSIRHKRKLPLPVVLITGQGNEEVVAHALRLGATDYLIKYPGYLHELTAVLEKAHTYSRLQQESAALHESENRFRQLVENSPDLIIRFDTSLRYLYVNQSVSQITALPKEDFVGKTNEELGTPTAQATLWNKKLSQVRDTAKPLTFTFELTNCAGDLRYWEAAVTPELGSAGQVASLLAVVRDITDRVSAEALTRLQSTALNAAANGIIITDTEGTVQWVNPAFVRLTGYAKTEAEGKNPRDLVRSGIHGQPFYQKMWETILAGNVWQDELVNRRKDGTLYHEIQTITPVRDDTGEITHFIGIKQDITDQKLAEVERIVQTERLQQILETVPDGIVLLDTAGKATLANPAGQILLVRLAGVAVGETVTQLGERPLTDWLQPTPPGTSYPLQHDNGHFELVIRPIVHKTAVGDWVMLLRDVTAEKEREQYSEVQQRLAAVGQLAAGIAHDFNNVMAVITLYTQLLQATNNLSAKGQQQLNTIEQQALHATDMIGQILDFSRRSVMERVTLDLLPLVKEMIHLLRNTLPANIRIDLHHDSKNYLVLADPTRIQQALMNIVLNARDAMPNGGCLQISLAQRIITPAEPAPMPDVAPGTWLELTIADQGNGVEPEHLPRIFDPFFTTKKAGAGTGLGLAQVYGIIRQHDGAIDVFSQPGHGATFTIYLPLSPKTAVATPTEAEPHLALPGRELILVVEDNNTLRASITAALSELGYAILEATNGQKALDILAEEHEAVNLVLSDIVMPEMGGADLAYTIQKQYAHLPILFMTGYPLTKEESPLPNLTWIRKPFTIQELSREIRAALDAA